MESALLYVIAAVIVAVGLAGTVLPVIPGVLLVFCGLFVAAWADAFAHVGWIALTIIGVLGCLGFVADLLAAALGAKGAGASPQALLGAVLGGVAGLFLGIPGLIFGPFFGAMAGEMLARGGVVKAGRVGLATWLGLVVAAVLKVAIAFLMIATFLAAWILAG
jgi:uncharacterized protein YqgC (DUF456 family)